MIKSSKLVRVMHAGSEMKKCSLAIVMVGSLLSGCACTATHVNSTPSPTAASTSTPSGFSTYAFTPTIATPAITAIPAIATFTPTFNASAIVTATPVEKATCPIAKPVKHPNFEFLNLMPGIDWENRAHAEQNALNFLNTNGADLLVSHLRYNYGKEGKYFAYKDLTNDAVPDLAIGLDAFYVFSCKNRQYEKILELPPDGYLRPPNIFSIKDSNRNGIPEMTLLIGVLSQGGHAYQIYEWNGEAFRNLLISDFPEFPDAGAIWVEATGRIFYQNIDNDPINELVLDSGIPVWSAYYEGLPWRNKRTIYNWNGQNYISTYHEFANPEFRFQAVQDGDLATNQSQFDKALQLYQDAIFSDELKDYSPEIRKNLQENWMSQIGRLNRPTPTPSPGDPAEYSQLAAYAYYRIILLHLLHGYETDAGIVFNTLQRKFSTNAGHPYAEMANAFMSQYQLTHNMTNACNMAIQYAAEHSSILVPLGSDYHGWQSHEYKPEDVCPFR